MSLKNHFLALPEVVQQRFEAEVVEFYNFQVSSFRRILYTKNYQNQSTFHQVSQNTNQEAF